VEGNNLNGTLPDFIANMTELRKFVNTRIIYRRVCILYCIVDDVGVDDESNVLDCLIIFVSDSTWSRVISF
jgi:hypothetical protein